MKEQITVRLTQDVYKYIKEKSEEIGSSQSSLINILIDLGRSVYEEKSKPLHHQARQKSL